MNKETAFSIDTTSIKFGSGVTQELGFEIKRMGCRRIMLLTDPDLMDSQVVVRAINSLEDESIEYVIFGNVRVEPTDKSFKEAISFAIEGKFDGFVAVGGGSTIDTAKAANLYSSYPEDFLTFVNPPIGLGKTVPGPLKPLIAIPTTSGTGSETTGVAIFDFHEIHAKTGIAHRLLRPTMGLVDPINTETLHPMVVACSGLDVLCHGLESYTALKYSNRDAPDNPGQRPAYQGANPISDVWSMKAIEMVAMNIRTAVNDPSDKEARSQMILAASFAGVGFGNAGCHLPHGMSYPVSGMVRDYQPDGYPNTHPIIPHGLSVAVNAPAVFRYTASSDTERHLTAANLMGANISQCSAINAGAVLSQSIVDLLRDISMPNGLQALGYVDSDIDNLVNGTLPQHRVTKLAPIPTGKQELRNLFSESMVLW